MIYIQAIKKRGILRQIVEGAVTSRLKVREALTAFQASVATSSFKQGRILVNTSALGQQASFEVNHPGKEFTQDSVFGMSEEFFDIFEEAMGNTPGLVDDAKEASSRAIFEAMRGDDRMQSVNRKGTDFTLLGFPQTGQLQ